MPSLSHSPLLQALGHAIANSLWQMALVWIVYVLLNSLFRLNSHSRYRLAVAAQVTGFSWFLITLQYYYQQCSQAMRIADSLYGEVGRQAPIVITSGNNGLLSFLLQAERVLPYLSLAYLLLLVFLSVKWMLAFRYTQQVRMNGIHKIDVDWRLFVQKVAGQLGIKHRVDIYLSELVKSPVTIGFFKPIVLIPMASINHLSVQQMEAVILHELAHIKRHDYLLNLVLSAMELVLFFNPFTRLLAKAVCKERENSCDDWVLQYQYNPAMYAEALLRIAVLQKVPAMAMPAVKSKGELLHRVQRMVHQQESRFNYRHQLLALLLMTGILSSMALFDPAAYAASDIPENKPAQAIVLEPMAAKINNPLFNPLSFLHTPLQEAVEASVRTNQRRLKTDSAFARIKTVPQVMPVLAIGNLKEVEKTIIPVAPAQPARPAAFFASIPEMGMPVILMDSLRSGKLTYNNVYIKNWQETIRQGEKTWKEALKNGSISAEESARLRAALRNAWAEMAGFDWQQMFQYDAAAFNGFHVLTLPQIRGERREEDNQRKNAEEARKMSEQRRFLATRVKGTTADSAVRRVYVSGYAAPPAEMPLFGAGDFVFTTPEGLPLSAIAAPSVECIPGNTAVAVAPPAPPSAYYFKYRTSGNTGETNVQEVRKIVVQAGANGQSSIRIITREKKCENGTETPGDKVQAEEESVVVEVRMK